MGVYIKGMKMPTSCYDCNCFIRDSDGSDYCCLLMQDIEDNHKRDDDCPLIPVPPHGRLIDADALQKSIEYVAGLDWNINVGASKGLEAAAYMVEDAMTIIPADKGGE